MLLFDLFQDAVCLAVTVLFLLLIVQIPFQSLKVRSRYIEQLRNLDIIAAHFLPTLLHFLQLGQGPLKVFKLDIWAVDEFHIECAFVISLTKS